MHSFIFKHSVQGLYYSCYITTDDEDITEAVKLSLHAQKIDVQILKNHSCNIIFIFVDANNLGMHNQVVELKEVRHHIIDLKWHKQKMEKDIIKCLKGKQENL